MSKPVFSVGEIIMVKSESALFTNCMWLGRLYPYAKVYRVSEMVKNNYDYTKEAFVDDKSGYEYHIGAVSKYQLDYWGTSRFVDYHEKNVIFDQISDNIYDNFYTSKELRKMKLEELEGRR